MYKDQQNSLIKTGVHLVTSKVSGIMTYYFLKFSLSTIK